MPTEKYFCIDNFFTKMTDLESPKKNNDCYFYYYSTCAKGDKCSFRHEPSALGCETMCSFWKEGKCLNIHCNFRHMELRKNRKAIPCYWESQPVGCLKAHCPFMHQNPRPNEEGAHEKLKIPSDKSRADNILKDKSERKVTAVDSLVVNFEEESDSESIPTYSPMKNTNRIVKVKTLEEIKLEKIQAESAAFYSYHDEDLCEEGDADHLRQRIVHRIVSKNVEPERRITTTQTFRQNSINSIKGNKRLSDDELANILGDESLRKKQKIVFQNEDGNLEILLRKHPPETQVSITVTDDLNSKRVVKQKSIEKLKSVDNIKIKTLAEIRAERNTSKAMSAWDKEESEVTSTSVDESMDVCDSEKLSDENVIIGSKIKLRRKLPVVDKVVSSANAIDCVTKLSLISKSDVSTNQIHSPLHRKDALKAGPKVVPNISKVIDEAELLDVEDDDLDNVTLKAEEDLLNEIDYLLDE